MARGWDSKSVEDQISQKDQGLPGSAKSQASVKALQKESKRAALRAAQKRTASAMRSTKNEGQKEFLQKALDDLDRQIQDL